MFSVSTHINVSSYEENANNEHHELMIANNYSNYDEAITSGNLISFSSPFPQSEHSNSLHVLTSSTNSNDNLSSPLKKYGHSKYERDRRKKVNKFYSFIKDLLPEKDQKKKLSIPRTIDRVLKYIPELQSRIASLNDKKQKLMEKTSKSDHTLVHEKDFTNPVISATFLSKYEIMIQICILNASMLLLPFSKVINILEREGLQIVNASTRVTSDDKAFYSIQLQAEENTRLQSQNYYEQLFTSLD